VYIPRPVAVPATARPEAQTFGRNWSPKTGRAYIGTRSSKKRLARLVTALRTLTGRESSWPPVPEKVGELTRLLVGWANYFSLGSVSRAYRAMDEQARRRLANDG